MKIFPAVGESVQIVVLGIGQFDHDDPGKPGVTIARCAAKRSPEDVLVNGVGSEGS